MHESIILSVEDDRSVASMLAEMLSGEGYTVIQAFTGEAGIEQALRAPPDLILLDILLPGINGFDVLRRLRNEPKMMHVPVIMVTARRETSDKIQALNLRVNGYLTKPFDNDELLACIRTHIYHAHTALLSPLTGLPGAKQVELAIERHMSASPSWTLLFLDLDHFKALNDGYGFWQGNEIIRLLARIITETIRDLGNMTDFVGHVGGEDFIVLTTPDRLHPICQCILKRFASESRPFYQPEDLSRQGFLAKGRDGEQHLFPLVSLSIAALLSERIPKQTNFAALSVQVAGVKARSKGIPGSCYVIDGDDAVYTLS
jgi:DNA-binding response OmpR family regulator